MNSYNLNEQSKARGVLKILGPIILGSGVVLLIVAMVDFFAAFNGSGMPTLFFLGFIGIPLIGIGGAMTQFAYMGKIARYSASQMAPVAKDMTNYMLDGTKNNISGMIASAASEIKNTANPIPSKCQACGETVNSSAVFCDHCGRPLFKVCPECNTKNAPDAHYCQKCGKTMAIY